jgi:hypothetical protein
VDALILSNALDTNGQNNRYAEAARKHGSDERILTALAIGKTDPAGVVGRFQAAAEKHGGLVIRSASKAKYEYLRFPMDIYWDRKSEKTIKELAEQADLIHLNNSHVAYRRFHLRKPALLHHHGSMFRSNPQGMFAVAKHHRFLQAVSTPDLLQPDPKLLHWLPTAYPVDELRAYGEANRREPDGRIRIVHAPTNRLLKHTDLFIRTVRELILEGLPIDLIVVENKTWAECLAEKAKADIVFDQLAYGYGCNSVEAWALGIPVISGGDDWTLDKMFDMWSQMPFLVADEQTLKHKIRSMVGSANLRADWAGIGDVHVRKYHDELPSLERLAELYHKAIKHYTRIRIPGKAPSVTFRSRTGRPVYGLDGERVTFDHGLAKVTDPDTITRMRTLTKRKNFGIEEVA